MTDTAPQEIPQALVGKLDESQQAKLECFQRCYARLPKQVQDLVRSSKEYAEALLEAMDPKLEKMPEELGFFGKAKEAILQYGFLGKDSGNSDIFQTLFQGGVIGLGAGGLAYFKKDWAGMGNVKDEDLAKEATNRGLGFGALSAVIGAPLGIITNFSAVGKKRQLVREMYALLHSESNPDAARVVSPDQPDALSAYLTPPATPGLPGARQQATL